MVRENAYHDLEDVTIHTLNSESQHAPLVVLLVVGWSGASHIMDTYMEDLAEKYHKKFRFYRQNVEKHKTLSQQLKVQKFPRCYIFKNGQIVDSFQGILGKKKIEQKLLAVK